MEIINIGKISLTDDLLEKCNIVVYGDENDPPHFHIESVDQHKIVCVEIFSAKQYSHNGRYNSKLSVEDCILLDNWLRYRSVKEQHCMTNWDYIVANWWGLNEDYNYTDRNSVTKIQPDYSLMNGF